MKFYTYLRIGVSGLLVLLIFYFYTTTFKLLPNTNKLGFIKDDTEDEKWAKEAGSTEKIHFKKSEIVVAVVACGDRLQETLNLIKSALMFSKERLNFVIFTDDNLIESFNEKLEDWKALVTSFSYKVMPLTFPPKDAEEWRKLFKPCAAQRLFLPNVLTNVDSLLYMDTDTLFLSPVEDIWDYFHKMNSSQMAALAPEHEDPNVAWYNRFAQHPYYEPLGVNSGVMLMNLTRLRAFKWSEYVVPIYKKFKLKLTWGDQDIINIIFHYHPGKLLLYSCRYNYRPDHCMYMSVCKQAEKDGVAVVHGSRGYFHSEKQPVFKAIYQAFEEFRLGGDLIKDFYQPLEAYLEEAKNSNCGHVKDAFLKNPQEFFEIDNPEEQNFNNSI